MVKPFAVVVVLACAAGALGSALVRAETPRPPSGQLGLEVTVSSAARPGQYLVEATISDLQDGRVLAAPRVTAEAGVPAIARSGVVAGAESYDLQLAVTVTSRQEVSYELTCSQGERIVGRQKATVRL